jgi:hypothetical protein
MVEREEGNSLPVLGRDLFIVRSLSCSISSKRDLFFSLSTLISIFSLVFSDINSVIVRCFSSGET